MRVFARAAAISALLSAPAMAGDPAALILDASGAITPQIEVYEELGDGTVLDLAPDASLTISHYGACEEVAVTGGTVSVYADKLSVDGGKILSRSAVECPGRIVMAAAELINMAVTLRSIRQAKVMGVAPEFVLAGEWGRQFDKLDVYGQEGHHATLPVTGGHAAWPENLAPLPVGEGYAVVLNGPGAKQHAARVEVAVDAQGVTVLQGR